MPVPLGRPQGESETHLAIFGKRRVKPFIQVSQAARSWATRCIGRRRTRGCWTPICKLWLLGSRCSAVAASVSKKPNLSLRAPSLVQNSQKPMNVSLDSLRGIHDRGSGTHIDRHSHRLHHFVAGSSLLYGDLGVKRDARVASDRHRNGRRDQFLCFSAERFRGALATRLWIQKFESFRSSHAFPAASGATTVR
jgi:hypothetical protein